MQAGRCIEGEREHHRPAPIVSVQSQCMSGARAAGRPPALVLARDGDRLLSPGTQGFGVLEEILRELIVLHSSASVAEGAKRSHSPRFELRARRVVDLEIKRVIRNQSEEYLAGIKPNAAKHWPRADSWHCPAQLIEDENSKAGTDCHGP